MKNAITGLKTKQNKKTVKNNNKEMKVVTLFYESKFK